MSFRTRLAALAVLAPLSLTACAQGAASDPSSTPERIVSGTTSTSEPSPSATPEDVGGPATAAVTDQSVVATGLSSPWDLELLADGSFLVSERDTAAIKHVRAGVATALNGPGAEALRGMVDASGEGGLLGIAVLEGDTSYLYAYVTRADDNAVVRMALNGDLLGQPTTIIDGIPKAKADNGGRIAFGPDGHLYVATGDAGREERARDSSALAGKILRVVANGGDKDGTAAKGNPWGNRVWSLGHRNVEGLAWVADGRMYASELGADAWDELNLIESGADYGWPASEGQDGLPIDGVTAPVVSWSPNEASPSGVAATHEAVYVASLKGERLWRVPLTAEGTGDPQVILDGLGRIRDVAAAADGSLYVLTDNTDSRGKPTQGDDRVVRITVG
ncbi:PQQ-dependent sugar dehydrogenase [Demequina soli]|uniref:PQQ-dependent sugar dehydrogenase n=1 Tax=Demequina soli TaxID=1638987 RepID=UPI0007805AF5|nr:PQQ-dependent sugar dehydrogenase [Demequina soli]